MTFTDIQASTTKTATFNGASIDVSGFTGDWTIKLQVSALTDAKQARFVFQDSVNDFTASISGPCFNMKGYMTAVNDKVKSFKKQDFPGLRLGTASARLRLALVDLDGSASVTYRSWIES